MIHWKLYYGDGTTYSNLDGSWIEAPSVGVVCVVVRDPTEVWGRFVNSGFAPKKPKCDVCKRAHFNDFYVNLPESMEPRATHDPAAFLEQAENAGIDKALAQTCIKFAVQVEQQVWQDIMLAAGSDTDFPSKKSPRRRYSDWK